MNNTTCLSKNVIKNYFKAFRMVHNANREIKQGNTIALGINNALPCYSASQFASTIEFTLFCKFPLPILRTIKKVFYDFDADIQKALTFPPTKELNWISRINLWKGPLYQALPNKLYYQVINTLTQWAIHCKKGAK